MYTYYIPTRILVVLFFLSTKNVLGDVYTIDIYTLYNPKTSGAVNIYKSYLPGNPFVCNALREDVLSAPYTTTTAVKKFTADDMKFNSTFLLSGERIPYDVCLMKGF